jgi:hypothetical protein
MGRKKRVKGVLNNLRNKELKKYLEDRNILPQQEVDWGKPMGTEFPNNEDK